MARRSAHSDTCGQGGGGSKIDKICGCPLWMPPKKYVDVLGKNADLADVIFGDWGTSQKLLRTSFIPYLFKLPE